MCISVFDLFLFHITSLRTLYERRDISFFSWGIALLPTEQKRYTGHCVCSWILLGNLFGSRNLSAHFSRNIYCGFLPFFWLPLHVHTPCQKEQLYALMRAGSSNRQHKRKTLQITCTAPFFFFCDIGHTFASPPCESFSSLRSAPDTVPRLLN